MTFKYVKTSQPNMEKNYIGAERQENALLKL